MSAAIPSIVFSGEPAASNQGEEKNVGIPISSFSLDIQAELHLLNRGGDGNIRAIDVEVAMRGMINEKRGRIAVKSLDRKVQSALDELEPNYHGFLRFNKVEEALLALAESRKRSRFSTIGVVLLALGTLVFLGATFGLVYLVVDLRRDMKSMNGALVDSVTRKPIQTASSDLMLVNGVLVPRVTSQAARRTDGGDTELPIVTAIKTVFLNMSTTRTSKELAAISTLSIFSTDGIGAIHLAVDGAVVVPTASAPGGKVVIYSTVIGDMVLNGTALTPAVENLTPLTALYRAFPGVFVNGGRRLSPQVASSSVQTSVPTTGTCDASAGYICDSG